MGDNKYTNIYFIEDLINIDDTIDIIKRKIAIHLDILEEHQHLWTITNWELSTISKRNIYKLLTLNKKTNLTVGDIKDYFLNKNYISNIDLTSIGDDDKIITYNEWLKNSLIDKNLKNISQPIDKKTILNQKIVSYEINPYLLDDIELIDYRWVDKQGNKILKTIPNDYVILEKFYKITNNTIYLVDAINLNKYI